MPRRMLRGLAIVVAAGGLLSACLAAEPTLNVRPDSSHANDQPSSCERPAVSVWNFDHMLQARDSLKKGQRTYQLPYAALMKAAEKALQARPTSVTDKPADKVAQSGDKHDFISVGKYCWPNPKTADGMPWIQRDGYINQDSFKTDDAVRQDRMVDNVVKLSQAYFFSGDERFAQKAVELVRVWFIAPSTRMNPHFLYAQVIPGNDNNRGHFPGIIFGRVYINLLCGLNLVRRSPAYTGEFDRDIKRWFVEYRDWLLTSEFGKKEGKTTNNHSIAYDQQLLAVALFIDDGASARKIIADFHPVRIFKQVEPDGKMPRELARTRGLGYSAFNVKHMLEVCEMASMINPGLYGTASEDGRSIGKAVEYLAQFPGKTVEEFAPYKQIADWQKCIDDICWIVKWADKYEPAKGYGKLFQKHAGGAADHVNNLLY